MVWVLHYKFFGDIAIKFSNNRNGHAKDITRFQNYVGNWLSDEKKLELNNIIQDFYSRQDELYEGFFFSYNREEFISLELNHKICMVES